ncbi:MAG: hypothetical protein VW491_09205 [Gammaproteobacteria bacterium]
MRTLEMTVNPRMILWLAVHGGELTQTSRAKVARHLAHSLATCAPASFQYAVEVARVHVLIGPAVSDDVPFVPQRHVAVQSYAPAKSGGVAAAIANGQHLAMATRMYVYNLTVDAYEAACHLDEDTISPAVELIERTRQLIQTFASECTFKLNGDACVHHEIVTCAMSPWMSGCMAMHETPYSLMNFTYGKAVNDVLRPLIDSSTRSKLGDNGWVAQVCSADRLVHAFHVLAELVGNRRFQVLGNANICRGTARSFFVYRTRAGRHVYGVVSDGTYHHVSTKCGLAFTIFAMLSTAARLGCEDSTKLLAAITKPTQNGHFERYMTRAH